MSVSLNSGKGKVIAFLRNTGVLCLLLTCLSACKKDSPPPPSTAPGKATLIFPKQNEVCTEGRILSLAETAIDFRWETAENTDTYELTVKNLVTGEVVSQSTAELHLEMNLKRNAPYSWFIISKSRQTGITAKSDVFKFYNAGPGILSYAPFPAEIIAPVMGQAVSVQNSMISLDWNGNDVDGDLINYDVYFGTTQTPELLRSNLTESSLNEVSVKSKSTYYWRVVSRDRRGNTSDSGLFQFTVN